MNPMMILIENDIMVLYHPIENDTIMVLIHFLSYDSLKWYYLWDPIILYDPINPL